jgi:hypothetical protein
MLAVALDRGLETAGHADVGCCLLALSARKGLPSMITAIVTAKLPPGFTSQIYAEHAARIAERFQDIPGLIRKQFLFNPEEGLAGGVYLWETREFAEACYRGVWRENFMNAFGVEPQIRFFESPVVVDNESRVIKTAA